MISLKYLSLTLLSWAHNPFAAALSSNTPRAAWPNGPFTTSGRWIVDASGANVSYAGVNWPASLETMIPEGLQYQSVASIVSRIKEAGLNSIRLTYAIEMIDQIEDNGGTDIAVQAAFTQALGQANGSAVFNQILSNNPSFDEKTTRLQVFDAVAAECAKQNILVHLDNHVSKASWCCSPIDGNSWWGDEYFSVSNWTRGLSYMAQHGKSWPSLVSMSLRNELRQPLLNFTLFTQSYNWADWYKYVKQGASAIHDANSDVLIFLSGLDSDATLEPVVQGSALTPGTGTFNPSDFDGYANKLILELHKYNIVEVTTNCTQLDTELFDAGFQALTSSAKNQFPVLVTEFGFEQNATAWQGVYPSCLSTYLQDQSAGWMIWPLSGSYYIREGKQDYDETWGLLNHDWSDWRSPEYVNGGLRPLVNATLSVVQNNETTGSSGGGTSGGSGPNGSGAIPGYGGGRFDVMALTFFFVLISWHYFSV